MIRANVTWAALLLTPLGGGVAAAADRPEPAAEAVRKAVEKALPLLVKGAEGHVEQRTCFACHNQAVPLLALTTARDRGFAVRAEHLTNQLGFIATFLDRNRDRFLKGQGTGGQVDTAGYALWTLELGGWKPDATTAAVAEYLLQYHQDRDHWHTSSNRPPSEASAFTPNYLAVRALQKYGTAGQQERIGKRLDTIRAWLRKTPAKDTEDRVFRLWALQVIGADADEVKAAAAELIRTQHDDGGWAQLAAMDSDAYATGTALVALHRAAGLAPDDPVYRRGLAFLLGSQRDDGTWLVRSRSKPFQTYYESGFPHGPDQFISMAATGWAVTALALACPAP